MKQSEIVKAFEVALSQQNTGARMGLDTIEKLQNKQKLERLRDEIFMSVLPACYAGYVDHAKHNGWDEGWKDGVISEAYLIADLALKAREINHE